MFRVVLPPIIRSAYNCIYSIWYLSQHRYCYLPQSWKSWNWFECAVGGVRVYHNVQINKVKTKQLNFVSKSVYKERGKGGGTRINQAQRGVQEAKEVWEHCSIGTSVSTLAL
jgi:hypothetical protein